MATSIWKVPRNSIAAARRFYRSVSLLSQDEVRVLLKLQDDPAELAKVMKAESWKIAGA